ncbi:amidohydrolase family protein [Brevibacillus sp. B_LB10_24]|uniref:amidohydrolase family protein n=1 Tax=Brevibacillus sp. B_LB10_24 TaxID=3380645 RepID=UPI0038BD6D9F
MGTSPLIIRGGTLVTGFGTKEADIWIEQGQIRRIAKDRLKKRIDSVQTNVFDAAGFYVLPGFISLPRMGADRFLPPQEYQRQLASLVRRGSTCFIDTIHVESWMDEAQVVYQLARHYNSPVDHSVRLQLTADAFTADRLRRLRSQGFFLYEVTLRSLREAAGINWDSLYPVISQSGIAVHLHIPEEAALSVRERSDLIRLWTVACLYGKVRTCIRGVEPLEDEFQDVFYRIAQLTNEQEMRELDRLFQDWYGYFPAICPAEDLSIYIGKGSRTPEELLSLLVRMSSTNIAKAFGCYPQKGCLAAGADADLILIEKDKWLTNFSTTTILKFDEYCFPTYVMSKGKWLYQQGEYTDVVGAGDYLQKLSFYKFAI